MITLVEWTDPAVWGDYALKLLITLVLSGLVGLDRQLRNKTAGLRTHMLVSMGALIFTLIGMELFLKYSPDGRSVDPVRFVAAIVGGLGFLGAGAIIQSRGDIRGLTTATSIWTMGALGLCVGVGNYPLAVLTTVSCLIILLPLDRIEERYINEIRDGQEDTSSGSEGDGAS
jgi:putative Mg2+ transporter-C (MgtC) family protein